MNGFTITKEGSIVADKHEYKRASRVNKKPYDQSPENIVTSNSTTYVHLFSFACEHNHNIPSLSKQPFIMLLRTNVGGLTICLDSHRLTI